MLTKWKLFNFKSVQRETELSLAPLTIFAGPNSSGKSTWIQSILLISQTLASKVPSPAAVVLNGHLAKLGQFDDLKSYNSEADQILIGWEIDSSRSEKVQISDDLEFRVSRFLQEETPERIGGEIFFDANPFAADRDINQLQPRLFQYQMYCLSRDKDNLENDTKITIKLSDQDLSEKVSRLKIGDSIDETLRKALDREVSIDSTSNDDPYEASEKEELVGCIFSHHFLPSRLVARFNESQEKASFIITALVGDPMRISRTRQISLAKQNGNFFMPKEVVDFLFKKLNLFDDKEQSDEYPTQGFLFSESDLYRGSMENLTILEWVELTRRSDEKFWRTFRRKVRTELTQEDLEELNKVAYEAIVKDKQASFSIKAQPLPRNIRAATEHTDSFFSNNVKYLGPLRDEPKALYPLAPSVDPADIGLRGEYTAAVFDRYKDQRIHYIPTDAFPDPQNSTALNLQPVVRSLKAAVLDWLAYLQIAEDLSTKDMGKLGHELKVKLTDSDQEQDLMHVGVGVSQVLPILIVCLLADEDTTLIFEQPELHLHPFVQTRLADFFLSMSLLNKQCIIETHSEYLINRLRFRVASDPALSPQDSLNQKIKIYFTEKVEGVSQYREVAVNKYGAIVDWPKGFFDQSQREAEEILRASMAKRKQEKDTRRQAMQRQTQGEGDDA
jgi:predicted ATPase